MNNIKNKFITYIKKKQKNISDLHFLMIIIYIITYKYIDYGSDNIIIVLYTNGVVTLIIGLTVLPFYAYITLKYIYKRENPGKMPEPEK